MSDRYRIGDLVLVSGTVRATTGLSRQQIEHARIQFLADFQWECDKGGVRMRAADIAGAPGGYYELTLQDGSRGYAFWQAMEILELEPGGQLVESEGQLMGAAAAAPGVLFVAGAVLVGIALTALTSSWAVESIGATIEPFRQNLPDGRDTATVLVVFGLAAIAYFLTAKGPSVRAA